MKVVRKIEATRDKFASLSHGTICPVLAAIAIA
jgi:hypothetical protein